MRIMRYVASDVRHAIRQIRRELGPDAVILSNRKVEDGVEISAAIDYDDAWVADQSQDARSKSPPKKPRADSPPPETPRRAPVKLVQSKSTTDPGPRPAGEQATLAEVTREISALRGLVEGQLSGLAWGDMARRHPVRAGVFQQLLALGMAQPSARKLCERIDPSMNDRAAAWRRALGLMAHAIRPFGRDVLEDGGVYALLGPTGAGKTTTIAKLAARFALRHGASEVALLTADTYRIGAQEQLSAFAQIMGIPVRVVHELADLRQALEHYRAKRLVLIDTAGTSQRDVRFAQQAALIHKGAPEATSLLVLPATAQHRALEESVRSFGEAPIGGCVITKLDEAVSLGAIISILNSYGLPAAYLTNGQRVPEDICTAQPHVLVTRAVTLADTARRAEDPGTDTVYGGAPLYASH